MQHRLPLVSVLVFLASGCGGSQAAPAPPTCVLLGQTNCTQPTSFMSVAEKSGNTFSLFREFPYSGPPTYTIAAKGAESFALSLTVDTPPTLYVGEYPNIVASFDFPYTSPNGTITSGINDPAALAAAVNGGNYGIYVANRGANDVAFYSFSNPSVPAFTISGLHAPNGLGYDAGGNLWVSEAADVIEFNPPLSQNSTPARTISSGLKSPNGIAFDSSGTMYVSDSGSNAILVYPPGASSPSVTVMNGIKAPGQPFISAGDILVPNTGNNTIAEYALPLTASSSPIAVNSTGMNAPAAITFISR